MKKIIVAVLLALGLLSTMSLVACGPTETRMNTFSVGAIPTVNVTTGNGNVSLVVAQEGEIIVTAELRKPDSVEYEVYRDGDLITVNAKTRSGSRADVTITVPENTDFDLSSGNGDVSAVGVQASGQVTCGNGSLTLDQITGDVNGSTGNGDITVKGVTGSFNLTDGNGDITVSDATGSFNLINGNGDTTLRDAIGSFNLINGNGDIGFHGELTPDSVSQLSTGNGNATVELTDSPNVALDLEIEQRGTIRCDLQATVSEKSNYRFVGTIGDGEAELIVRTGIGNIIIK